jgi:PAS domain S-box-containing protein
MVWMSAPDGACTYFNEEWLSFRGRRLEEELGEGWVEGVHPEDREGCVGAYKSALAAQRAFRLEYRLRRHDGVFRTVIDHGVPLTDATGAFLGYSGTCLDATELEAALRVARESEARLAAAFDALAEGVVIIGADRRYLMVNRSAGRIAGTSADDYAQRRHGDPRWHAFVPGGGPIAPEDLPPWRTLEDGKPRDHVAMEIVRPDGERALILASTRPLVHEGEERPYAVVASFVDVTEQRRLEQQVRTNEAAAELGRLVGGIVHEVRGRVFGITATLDAFRAAHGNGAASELVRKLEKETTRLRRFTDELLHLGRPLSLDRAPRDLARLAADAVREASSRAAEAGVSFELMSEGEARVPVDAERLLQVLENLLSNALQHAPRGSRVSISVTREGPKATLWIRDRGRGFTAEDLQHACEPFYSRRAGGTGLGLAICKRIVNAHGGVLLLENHPDGGARAGVRLPAAP